MYKNLKKGLKIAIYPKVSVIIVEYKNSGYLKKCLESVSKQTYKNLEVIVVFNEYTHKSHEEIRKVIKDSKYIYNKKNLGFAKAINQGIKISSGEYIITLNNDVILDKNFIKNMIKCAKEEKVDMVSSKMLFMDKKDIINSRGVIILKEGKAEDLDFMKKDSEKFNKREEVLGPTGGAGLFSRKIFENVGLFDGDFFAYYEDVDLILRARLMGYKCFYEPKAVVYHKSHGQFKENKILYFAERNLYWLLIKNFPSKEFPKLLLLNFKGNLLKVHFHYIEGIFFNLVKKITFRKIVKLKKPKTFVLVRAMIASFFGFPKFFRKRKLIQKMKKIDFEEIRKFFKK